MGVRKPKPIPYEEQVWPIFDNPLDMSRRLAFAGWLRTVTSNARTGFDSVAGIVSSPAICGSVSRTSSGPRRLVTAMQQMEYLGLYGKRLTDRGLERIPEMTSLPYLSIDVPGVSREAIERLHRDCPALTIQVERDMRRRIGPA